MNVAVKSFLMRSMPALAGALRRSRPGLGRTNQSYIDNHGLRVLTGPFAGMNYLPVSTGSAFIPKLLGSYELELNTAINNLVELNPEVVVDIGCAEGYYAVGFALKVPMSHVYAFDTDAQARRLCKALVRINDVTKQVTIAGTCTCEQLNDLLKQHRTLVICDCEGCEYHLLQPDLVPNLLEAFLLVELHPWASPTTSHLFLEAFTASHDICLLKSAARDPADFPQISFLSLEQRKEALNEFRPPAQEWAYMAPKTA